MAKAKAMAMARSPGSTALLVALSLAIGLIWACVGELPGPPICSGQSVCGKGHTCVLGRCRQAKQLPVSKKAAVVRFEPEAYVLLRDTEDAEPAEGAREAIVLGGPEHPATIMLLRFAVKLPDQAEIQSALLVLDALPKCGGRPGKISLELAHVLSAWEPQAVSFNRRPELSIPMKAATAHATPPRPLRLDVTQLVAEWRDHRSRYHGLALLATRDSGAGACYSTGLSWGRGPRLEIYLKPKPKKKKPQDAGADASSDASPADASSDAAVDAAADAGDDDW